jgi:AraC-like DNA-binding protein
METSSHLQHQPRSLWAALPQEQQPDRLKPVAAPLRRPMRLLREEPTDTLACSAVAARLESIESFGAMPNSCHPSSMPACGRRLRPPARRVLAAWQQLVVAAYIRKHIAESIRISALARFVYMSPHCFCRAFKQSFGMPPHRYLVQQRIGRAKAMLARSEYSMSEISLALGFSQISSFSAAFRHVTGLSPTEYRRTQQ